MTSIQRKHREELEALLARLKKKQALLETELRKEKDAHKHKRREKELEIVRAQYDKGMKALQALEAMDA